MSDYISHHGVEGQKWGVKNGPPYPLEPSRDFHGKKPTKKQLASYARKLTDEQLRDANKRLGEEQKYINMVYTPTNKEKAKEFVKKQIKNLSTGVIDAATKKAGQKIAESIINAAIDAGKNKKGS